MEYSSIGMRFLQPPMKTAQLIQIYQCFCDETRLRILNALSRGPLCVCHLQELLGESQVKVSKHLSYLRTRGLLTVERHHNWMIYSLTTRRSKELEANLQCLQDCVQTHAIFKNDLRQLAAMHPKTGWLADRSGAGGKGAADSAPEDTASGCCKTSSRC